MVNKDVCNNLYIRAMVKSSEKYRGRQPVDFSVVLSIVLDNNIKYTMCIEYIDVHKNRYKLNE